MDFAWAFLELAQRILLYHILPTVVLSCTMLLIVSALVKLGRIQNPSTRGILFSVALLKPLFVLVQGTFPSARKLYAPVSPSLVFPDPVNFVPTHLWRAAPSPIETKMGISLAVVLAVVGFLLFWRWRSYYLFCQRVSNLPSSNRKEKQSLENALERLEGKLHTRGTVQITETKYESPFSVGIKNPVMVFPAHILAHLDPQEEEAVVAHELTHIREKDTLRQWMPVILKDLLVFSPFAHSAFAKIAAEREKRTDQAAARHLDDSSFLSSALLKTAKLMVKKREPLPMTQSFLTQRFSRSGRVLSQRLRALSLLSKTKQKPSSWPKRVFLAFGIAVLIYPQIFLHFRALSYSIQIF